MGKARINAYSPNAAKPKPAERQKGDQSEITLKDLPWLDLLEMEQQK